MGMILYYLTKMNMKIHTIKTIPELLEDCDILYWKHNRCSTPIRGHKQKY